MMKTLLSAVLFTAIAGAAQAEVRLETRGYHSNLRVDADSVFAYENGEPVGSYSVSEAFYNAAGGGIAAIFHADESAEFGLGFNLARYYPAPDAELSHQEITAFSRWHVLQPGALKLYGLVGVSSHEFDGRATLSANEKSKISYTPVANYDIGIGSSYAIGAVDLGLEYKYSNTLGTGSATLVNKTKAFDGLNLVSSESKGKFQGVKVESQELALTIGLKL